MKTKNNQIHSQIKIDLNNITKIGKYKNWTWTDKNKTGINITKIDKYKKNWIAILWRITKHMNITK